MDEYEYLIHKISRRLAARALMNGGDSFPEARLKVAIVEIKRQPYFEARQ